MEVGPASFQGYNWQPSVLSLKTDNAMENNAEGISRGFLFCFVSKHSILVSGVHLPLPSHPPPFFFLVELFGKYNKPPINNPHRPFAEEIGFWFVT